MIKLGTNCMLRFSFEWDIDDIDDIIITFKSTNTSKAIIQKHYLDNDFVYESASKCLYVPLLQTETQTLGDETSTGKTTFRIECQINFKNKSVTKTAIISEEIDNDTLATEYVSGDTPSSAEMMNYATEIVGVYVLTEESGDSQISELVSEVLAGYTLDQIPGIKEAVAESKSYAVGGTNTRDGEDTDNSKYYYEQTKALSDTATSAKSDIDTAVSNANTAKTDLEKIISDGKTTLANTADSEVATAKSEIESAASTAKTSVQDLVDDAQEAYDNTLAITPTLYTGTLTAGETSITITGSKISDSAVVTFYTSIYGVMPTNAVISSGSATLTFEAQESDMTVGVKIEVVLSE